MALWTPANIVTAGWWDFSDSSSITESSGDISQVNDKSGNGRDAVQATGSKQPLVNSAAQNVLDTATFDGSTDNLYVNNALDISKNLGSFSVYVVAKRTGGDSPAVVWFADDGDSENHALTVLGELSGNARAGGRRVDSDSFDTISRSATLTNFNIIGGEWDWANSDLYVWVNGESTVEASFQSAGNSSSATAAQKPSIGSSNNGSSNNWGGDIAEVIVLQEKPIEATRQLIEGYLAHKWGLEADLPGGHPYKSAAPTTGPTLSNPDANATGETTATATVETDTDNGDLYGIFTANNSEPDDTQIQAGQDGTGAAAAWSGSLSISATGEKQFDATGLSAGTTYYFFAQHEDSSAELSNVVTDSFTTEAGFSIVTQPADSTVYVHSDAQFQVIVNDPTGTATYQWFLVDPGGDTSLTGEVSDTLNIPDPGLGDNGKQYKVVVSRAGEDDLVSNTVTLTVTARAGQKLPGTLNRANYPEFFPCATWQHDQQIGPGTQRQQFASGWIRQRKQQREEVSSGRLAFTMPTTMFDNWSRWMINNGYDWFTISLDRFFGVLAIYECRLISTIQWSYRTHDVVDAFVQCELGAVVNSGDWTGLEPGPEGPPEVSDPPGFGPDEGPPGVPDDSACQPYSCSAFVDEAVALGYDVVPFIESNQTSPTVPAEWDLAGGAGSGCVPNASIGDPMSPEPGSTPYQTWEVGVDACAGAQLGMKCYYNTQNLFGPGFSKPHSGALTFISKGSIQSDISLGHVLRTSYQVSGVGPKPDETPFTDTVDAVISYVNNDGWYVSVAAETKIKVSDLQPSGAVNFISIQVAITDVEFEPAPGSALTTYANALYGVTIRINNDVSAYSGVRRVALISPDEEGSFTLVPHPTKKDNVCNRTTVSFYGMVLNLDPDLDKLYTAYQRNFVGYQPPEYCYI